MHVPTLTVLFWQLVFANYSYEEIEALKAIAERYGCR